MRMAKPSSRHRILEGPETQKLLQARRGLARDWSLLQNSSATIGLLLLAGTSPHRSGSQRGIGRTSPCGPPQSPPGLRHHPSPRPLAQRHSQLRWARSRRKNSRAPGSGCLVRGTWAHVQGPMGLLLDLQRASPVSGASQLQVQLTPVAEHQIWAAIVVDVRNGWCRVASCLQRAEGEPVPRHGHGTAARPFPELHRSTGMVMAAGAWLHPCWLC